jgi:hypothetical protein
VHMYLHTNICALRAEGRLCHAMTHTWPKSGAGIFFLVVGKPLNHYPTLMNALLAGLAARLVAWGIRPNPWECVSICLGIFLNRTKPTALSASFPSNAQQMPAARPTQQRLGQAWPGRLGPPPPPPSPPLPLPHAPPPPTWGFDLDDKSSDDHRMCNVP